MVVLSFIMLLIDIPTIPSFCGPAHKVVLSYSTFFIFLIVWFRDLKAENLPSDPDGLWKHLHQS